MALRSGVLLVVCWYEPKANDPMAELDAEFIAREFSRLESLVVERS